MANRRAAFWACSVLLVAEAVHGLGDAFLETELACRLPEPLRSLDLGRRLRGRLLQPVDLKVDVAEDAPRDDADHTEEQDDREPDGDHATHPALKDLDQRREQDGADARGREERGARRASDSTSRTANVNTTTSNSATTLEKAMATRSDRDKSRDRGGWRWSPVGAVIASYSTEGGCRVR